MKHYFQEVIEIKIKDGQMAVFDLCYFFNPRLFSFRFAEMLNQNFRMELQMVLKIEASCRQAVLIHFGTEPTELDAVCFVELNCDVHSLNFAVACT